MTKEGDNPNKNISTAELGIAAEKLTKRTIKAEYSDDEIADVEKFLEENTTLTPSYEIARDTLFINDVIQLQKIEEELGERGKNN